MKNLHFYHAIGFCKIRKHKPDMVVLDVMMPEMDGVEVVRELKNDETLAYIPVILLTAKGQMMDIEKGFKSGVNAYMVKPFSPEKLMEKIEELFEVEKMKEKVTKARVAKK